MADGRHITSRHNPRVTDAARLRTGRERRRRGQFLIDGDREICRALASGIRCLEAFVCDDAIESQRAAAAIESLQSAGVELWFLSRPVFEKLAFGERDDGAVVVAADPKRTLAQLTVPKNPVVAVVEGIEKPGNLGAILRSADAAGVDAVIAADSGTDLYNPNTIRASLGTVFRGNVCQAASAEALAWIASKGLSIIAARPDAERSYTEVDLKRGIAIVLGSEAEGLSDTWRGAEITPAQLPMLGIADSLNVSTAAAVLFYEALRQRGHGQAT